MNKPGIGNVRALNSQRTQRLQGGQVSQPGIGNACAVNSQRCSDCRREMASRPSSVTPWPPKMPKQTSFASGASSLRPALSMEVSSPKESERSSFIRPMPARSSLVNPLCVIRRT